MRRLKNVEKNLFCQWSDHRFSKELKKISEILDAHPEFICWVAEDLSVGISRTDAGAHGMTAEQVLRAAIIKQQNCWSYEFLELQFVDSCMTRSFVRLGDIESYKKSTLQENISKIKAATWVKINNGIVQYANKMGYEKGRTVRIDATVISSNIHHPSDSSLLFDALRVSDREFKKIRKKTRTSYYLPLTIKQAKTELLKIQYAKNAQARLIPYKVLIKAAKEILKTLPKVINRFEASKKINCSHLKKVLELLPLIISQTERRVINGEQVPSNEKIFSIFEDHTDIIIKGKRDVEYGHKVFLTGGKSGLVTDCQLVQGNPSDSEFFLDLLNQHKEIYGRVPRQTSADGGFSSEDNVFEAKEMGVKDVCFSKHAGLEIEDMVKSPWVFQKLRKFRAGIEGIISCLKRGFGISKVLWKGVSGFASYVHSSIVAYNLTLLSRLQI